MKKIYFGLPFYIMFFTFTLLVEIYCYLEWRKDTVSIIGTSIVFLIALYLLIDSIKNEVQKKKKEYYNHIEEQYNRIDKLVDEKVGEAKEELLHRQKTTVEVLLKAQKSFTEAIIKDNSKR
jgi:F0F1-type ATP synthase membrane subunit b/b'